MTLFALSKTQESGGQIALAAVLAAAGLFLLLPRPRGRSVTGGVAALLAAAGVFGAWVYTTFGNPLPDAIGTFLFWMFASGAVGFGAVLVTQRNPARGAIAFAFVILSTCGLFLLLAAPFLMAATIIVYAGAIVVTFLFVLMLSHAEGPSGENDRSREPLYGSLAGFAFVGLILFTLQQTSQASTTTEGGEERTRPGARLPAPVVSAEERKVLAETVAKLDEASAALNGDTSTHTARGDRLTAFTRTYEPVRAGLAPVVGDTESPDALKPKRGSIRERLTKATAWDDATGTPFRDDEQARTALARAERIRKGAYDLQRRVEAHFDKPQPDVPAAKAEVRQLRDEVALLYGMGELPAANVRNLGFVLYSEYLLAVELAGTLLLVATVGAVAVAHRKGGAR